MKRQLPALIFVAAVAGVLAWWFFSPNPQQVAFRTRELATRGLAEHLVRVQAGKRVLIVSNPFVQDAGTARAIKEMEEAGVRGLREGFGTAVTIDGVAYPELKPGARENPQAALGDVETSTPLSYLMTPDALDRLVKLHPGCDLVVSLIGLPAELERCENWSKAGAPRFALLLPDLRIVGDAAAVATAVKSGKLAAFVLARKGGPGDDVPHGGDPKAEFEKRFVLVTAENVEQTLAAMPELF